MVKLEPATTAAAMNWAFHRQPTGTSLLRMKPTSKHCLRRNKGQPPSDVDPTHEEALVWLVKALGYLAVVAEP